MNDRREFVIAGLTSMAAPSAKPVAQRDAPKVNLDGCGGPTTLPADS